MPESDVLAVIKDPESCVRRSSGTEQNEFERSAPQSAIPDDLVVITRKHGVVGTCFGPWTAGGGCENEAATERGGTGAQPLLHPTHRPPLRYCVFSV